MDEPTTGGTAAGTASVVLGIFALALVIVPYLGIYGLIPAFIALVLGIVSKRQARAAGRPKLTRATVGIVLGTLSLLLGLTQTISVPVNQPVDNASWTSTSTSAGVDRTASRPV